MATYVITSPDGTKYRITGEGTREDALKYVQENQSSLTGMPQQRESYGEPIERGGQYQIGNEAAGLGIAPNPTAGAETVIEPALALGSAALAETVGNIGGGLQYFSGQGPQAAERIKRSLTYEPKSEGAKRVMRGYADLLAPVGEAIEKTRLGDEALKAGYPEQVARVAEAIPEYAGALLAATGFPAAARKPPLSAPQPGKPVKPLSRVDVAIKDGKVIKNPLGKKAASSGWDDRAVAYVSMLDKGEKNIYKNMLDKAKSYFTEFSPKGRPSDVVGNEISKRIVYLKSLKTKNGKLLDKIAQQQLANKRIDIDDFVGQVMSDVSKLGGKLDDNGKLIFDVGSDLFERSGDQKALAGLFEKLKISGNPTALEAHKLKRWIDNYINYNTSPTTKAEGLSGQIETLLKGYREALNQKVRGLNKNYAQVNDIYSDSAGALRDMQKAIGPSVDITSDAAPAAIGQKMRTFLSNNANRIRTEEAVGEIQAMANKWGGKFPDHDIAAQMRFINEMEKMWGPFTETSFKAEIGQAGQRIAESPSAVQLAREGVRLTGRQLRKAKQSREAQIRAMEKLLDF